jgi:hypothetical protein
VYAALAWYLDQVLPNEYGGRKSVFFFLPRFLKCLSWLSFFTGRAVSARGVAGRIRRRRRRRRSSLLARAGPDDAAAAAADDDYDDHDDDDLGVKWGDSELQDRSPFSSLSSDDSGDSG